MNALVHRDYSIHTEGMPIQLQIFPNRIVVSNPGGLYGRIGIDKLGQVQPDTRNPVLATALELMGITENRYSGIPTIRREMTAHGLPLPQFEDSRGTFKVTLSGEKCEEIRESVDILAFCETPRTRQEIANYLKIKSVPYAITTYVMPLVKSGDIILSIPEHPKSPKQKFTANKK